MKRLEVWLWFTAGGIAIDTKGPHATKEDGYRHHPFMHLSQGHQLVRLVPYSAAKERVVLAAKKFIEDESDDRVVTTARLVQAVAALNRRKGKR